MLKPYIFTPCLENVRFLCNLHKAGALLFCFYVKLSNCTKNKRVFCAYCTNWKKFEKSVDGLRFIPYNRGKLELMVQAAAGGKSHRAKGFRQWVLWDCGITCTISRSCQSVSRTGVSSLSACTILKSCWRLSSDTAWWARSGTFWKSAMVKGIRYGVAKTTKIFATSKAKLRICGTRSRRTIIRRCFTPSDCPPWKRRASWKRRLPKRAARGGRGRIARKSAGIISPITSCQMGMRGR